MKKMRGVGEGRAVEVKRITEMKAKNGATQNHR